MSAETSDAGRRWRLTSGHAVYGGTDPDTVRIVDGHGLAVSVPIVPVSHHPEKEPFSERLNFGNATLLRVGLDEWEAACAWVYDGVRERARPPAPASAGNSRP